MKRFFSKPQMSNFLRSRSRTDLNVYKRKHDFLDYEENEIKISNSNKFKQLSSKLFGKILDHKDTKTKQQMIEVYIKINPESRLKAIPVDYLLKSRVKKKEMQDDIQNLKVSDVLAKKFSIAAVDLKESNEMKPTASCSKDIPRPKRGEPGEVIWGFVPREWTIFFVPITGHSGFYTLLVTFGTYLLSKEIYVCDHEYYNGISTAILWIYIVKKKGAQLAKYLDKEIDKFELELNINKEKWKQNIRDAIILEIKHMECVEGQLTLIEAKRENVHLQREAEFRRRQMEIYENVKRILDYHVAVGEVRKKIQHKNLIQWVMREIEKSLSPELKDKYVGLCIADFERMLREINKEKGKK